MVLELVGYFDASGHPSEGEVLTVGGYIGDVRSWTRFDLAWLAILKDIGLDEFHMADFMVDPRFEGRRDEILQRLIVPIRRNARKSVATMIYLDDWREVSRVYDLRR